MMFLLLRYIDMNHTPIHDNGCLFSFLGEWMDDLKNKLRKLFKEYISQNER